MWLKKLWEQFIEWRAARKRLKDLRKKDPFIY